MPFYEFRCQECGEEFTKRVSWREKSEVACPRCGSKKLREILGAVGLLRSGAGASAPARGCGSGFG